MNLGVLPSERGIKIRPNLELSSRVKGEKVPETSFSPPPPPLSLFLSPPNSTDKWDSRSLGGRGGVFTYFPDHHKAVWMPFRRSSEPGNAPRKCHMKSSVRVSSFRSLPLLRRGAVLWSRTTLDAAWLWELWVSLLWGVQGTLLSRPQF